MIARRLTTVVRGVTPPRLTLVTRTPRVTVSQFGVENSDLNDSSNITCVLLSLLTVGSMGVAILDCKELLWRKSSISNILENTKIEKAKYMDSLFLC